MRTNDERTTLPNATSEATKTEGEVLPRARQFHRILRHLQHDLPHRRPDLLVFQDIQDPENALPRRVLSTTHAIARAFVEAQSV
jgi:hypothetical protein